LGDRQAPWRPCERSWFVYPLTSPRQFWSSYTSRRLDWDFFRGYWRPLGELPVREAREGDVVMPGHIYIGPPDRHLLIDGEYRLHLSGPRENRFRPAIDPLFRSAAAHFGRSVIGVLLLGMLDDGVNGLLRIRSRGGLTIVQDPADASAPEMPEQAIRRVEVDFVLPAASIAEVLVTRTSEACVVDPQTRADPDTSDASTDALESGRLSGPSTAFTCPECGGALWEVSNDALIAFQCHGPSAERIADGRRASG
jgi:two-component system chemotaxis response regulator CheB